MPKVKNKKKYAFVDQTNHTSVITKSNEEDCLMFLSAGALGTKLDTFRSSHCLAFSLKGAVVAAFTLRVDSRVVALLFDHQKLI